MWVVFTEPQRLRQFGNVTKFTSDNHAYRFLSNGSRHTVYKHGVGVEILTQDPTLACVELLRKKYAES